VTVVAAEGMTPYASVCVEELKSILQRVCSNPSNPTFNHLLFETIASLVRYICAKTPAAVDSFEGLLFPPFQFVLQSDVSEFTPYVFQILAQLLECRTGLSAAYESLFPPLLMPTMWERPGNVPPLVRLICAYMDKGKQAVLPKIEGVLGVFQKLLASRATDAQAAKLLASIFRCFEGGELERYVGVIFNLCLTRLQSNKKVGKDLVHCWAIFVARYGAAAFRAQLEGAQPGLFAMILRGVWADNCSYVQGELPRKAVCISATKLLCETDLITDAACFGTMLQSLLTMVLVDQGMEAAPPADAATQEIPDLEQENEGDGSTGYAAAYAQLTFASSSEWDAYAGEAVPSYLVGSLSRLNSAHPGQLSAIVTQIAQALPAEKQQGVQALMQGIF